MEKETEPEIYDPVLAEIDWAADILDDVKSAPADIAKAKVIMAKQIEIEEDIVDEIDAIMDIEDDDERAKAWEAWEAEESA